MSILNRRAKRAEQETLQLIEKISSKKLNISFLLTGWKHLEGKAIEVQRNVELGDLLTLEADTENQYDNMAIQVIKDEYQIGWFDAQHPRKQDVFILLYTNKKVKAEVVSTYPTEIDFSYDPDEQAAGNTIPLK